MGVVVRWAGVVTVDSQSECLEGLEQTLDMT